MKSNDRMGSNNNERLNKVVASWSGGIDSTAVLANLVARGYHVIAVTVGIYDSLTPYYAMREREARRMLMPALDRLAETCNGRIEYIETDGSWMGAFKVPGSLAMPQRNKRVLDFLVAQYAIPHDITNIAMGEYIGTDTWVVSNHVPPNDCDHRALTAYMYHEYGHEYRFMSLADFGESRYKDQRLLLGYSWLGANMSATTNCMADELSDCGACYKCIERAAAFHMAGIPDGTRYKSEPTKHPAFDVYCRQMRGECVSLDYSLFPQHQ